MLNRINKGASNVCKERYEKLLQTLNKDISLRWLFAIINFEL